MVNRPERSFSRKLVYILAFVTGLAALSWEVLWQIKSSLALGLSALGTALTLAVTMGCMSAGAIIMARALPPLNPRPLRVYGIMELIIGCAGLLLHAAFASVEKLDTIAYSAFPGGAPLVHILGIGIVIGIPALCMGTTFPLFGIIARQYGTSISVLYGINTLGGAIGVLIVAFLLIPAYGVIEASWILAAANIAVGCIACLLPPKDMPQEANDRVESRPAFKAGTEELIVCVTGFATLALEVAWFRSLTAAFASTTDAFALMLASVLIAIGLAARLTPKLRKRGVRLGTLLSASGALTLIATPVIERFDYVGYILGYHVADIHTGTLYALDIAEVMLKRFTATLCVVAPPVFLLAVAFPWINDEQHTSRRWATLYALNAIWAVVGSMAAAWLILPAIGIARTAWLVGILVVLTGLAILQETKRRGVWAVLGIAALTFAVTQESGVGVTRIQGSFAYDKASGSKILEYYNGPDVTVSAVQYAKGAIRLIIDGMAASGQAGIHKDKSGNHYMPWMGYLPMMLHPAPHDALVICFGAGLTANAVRNENPETLDVVDINPLVFRLAHNFSENENVLQDARVKVIVMDGRAYMRRTAKMYDIVTLEPMPPNFPGSNALYSKEFYEAARNRLTAHGLIAQWLPFHDVTSYYAASIAKTFQSVFPNAILWLDPFSKNGVLLASRDDSQAIGTDWPGFARKHIAFDLTEEEVRKAILLDRKGMQRYGKYGAVITDDNQLLAYGDGVFSHLYYINNDEDTDLTDTDISFIKRFVKGPQQ